MILDIAPEFSDLGSTMIPLRAPLEAVGCKIEFTPVESIALVENWGGTLKLLVETGMNLRKNKKTASGGEIPDTSSTGIIEKLAKGTVLETSSPVETHDDYENIPYIKVVHGGKSGWVAIRKRDTKEEYLVIKTSGGGQVEGSGKTPTSASNDSIAFIANYEKFYDMPYRGLDDRNRTVGYGHVITKADGTKYDGLRNILTSESITYDAMHTEFMDWTKVNGEPTLGLYRRRMDELNVFFNGDYSRNYPDWP